MVESAGELCKERARLTQTVAQRTQEVNQLQNTIKKLEVGVHH